MLVEGGGGQDGNRWRSACIRQLGRWGRSPLPPAHLPRYGAVTGVMGVVLLKTSDAEVRAVRRIASMGTLNVCHRPARPEDGLVRIALRGDAASSYHINMHLIFSNQTS